LIWRCWTFAKKPSVATAHSCNAPREARELTKLSASMFPSTKPPELRSLHFSILPRLQACSVPQALHVSIPSHPSVTAPIACLQISRASHQFASTSTGLRRASSAPCFHASVPTRHSAATRLYSTGALYLLPRLQACSTPPELPTSMPRHTSTPIRLRRTSELPSSIPSYLHAYGDPLELQSSVPPCFHVYTPSAPENYGSASPHLHRASRTLDLHTSCFHICTPATLLQSSIAPCHHVAICLQRAARAYLHRLHACNTPLGLVTSPRTSMPPRQQACSAPPEPQISIPPSSALLQHASRARYLSSNIDASTSTRPQRAARAADIHTSIVCTPATRL